MRLFKNLSIRARLILTVGVMALLMVAIGLAGLTSMRRSNEALRTVYEDRTVPVGQLSKIARYLEQDRIYVLDAILDPTPDKTKLRIRQIEELLKKDAELWQAYMATYLTPEEKVLAERFATLRTKYADEGLRPALEALRAGDAKRAYAINSEVVRPTNIAARDAVDALLKLQLDEAKAEEAQAQAHYASTFALGAALTALGLLLALGSGFFLIRAIVRPLNAMIGHFEQIGRGNLSETIEVHRMDETGRALAALKATQGKLLEAAQKAADHGSQIAAIGKAQAVIEFALDGTILGANDNFLRTMGYTLEEVKGQHHRMFADPAHAASPEYHAFWSKLGRGEYDSGQYRRLAKGGREVWIQASYNPILDMHGKPFKVVKYATDITEAKLRAADFEGQLKAVSKAQAVIEFRLDGTILTANDNFLKTMGYALEEIRGKHHSLFADAAHAASPEYRAFWDKLGRGEYDAGQYKRIAKGGREVWIQASYNPIFDMNGQPFKVVKYATDITGEVQSSLAMVAAVDQTQAVIASAMAGDLTQRIPMEGKKGPIKDLCGGVNQLLDTTASSLGEVVRVLAALADGDLTQRIDRDFAGTFGKLKDDSNATVGKLTEIIGQVRQASEAISLAAVEVATGNTDLSQRTEEQASSLEETASSMEELTATVKQNADNARQANQLAASASEVAQKGGSVVSQVVSTMSSITDSSKKIVDIISVIDGIAFQTNILALNAAVEAARAGEQGRGFAVVASEVRNLAQRSAAAAKEIKALIGDSVEKVEVGSKLVEAAGKTMEDIVASVRRVTDIMSEISAASAEQSAGIEQVNQAITQMDQVTQQNAALVEQAAAAAESMKEQAHGLSRSVGTFRLDTHAAPASAGWQGEERRGPNRAKNVARIASPKPAAKVAPPAPAATGTDDDWQQF